MVDVVHGHPEVPAAIAPASGEQSGDDQRAVSTFPRPTPLWLVTQLVPSPEIVHGDDVTRFGMRWQVTPLLYSFGVHRGVFPWRTLVVEPLLRHNGSVELFFSPEYIPYGRSFLDSVLWRVGARSYFPVIEYGEYLSVSIGASYFGFAGRSGVAYEAGIYSLFGVLGAQVTWSPSGGPAATIATLRLRYF